MGGTIVTGTHGSYRWLTGTEQYMGDVVRLCPAFFSGRHLAFH